MSEPLLANQPPASNQPSSPAASSSQRPAMGTPASDVDLANPRPWAGESAEQLRGPQGAMSKADASLSGTLPGNHLPLPSGSDAARVAADAFQVGGKPTVPGFELVCEIACGGMGVVYQARDLTLNRIVAIKVLRDRYPPDSPVASRFLEEAQITSQLQHPGIPPIYQMGYLADGRPYLAMKLIKGETLKTQIERGEKLNYLALIEAIAQAVGYAHAHGVIHRDLKPQNIMVGRFGEVQVMDWGLAKVLTVATSQAGGQPTTDQAQASTIYNPRGSGSGSDTEAGTVVGTPAYMAPEQAGGEIDKLSPRADVFGLGAVLCELLTGQPPYSGTTTQDVLLQAIRGATQDAFARLDASGAEPGAIDLCKRCLAFHPEGRPADGNAVAQEVAALRREAEERAKLAELERARAEVMAAEQRKRRRVVQWSAAAVAAVLLIGLGLSLWQMSRALEAERQAAANEAQALAERDEKERQRQRAEINEQLALQERDAKEQQRRYAQAIADFVQNDFLGLASVEGQGRFSGEYGAAGLNRHTTLLALLNRAAGKLEARTDLDPLIEAQLRWMIGVQYRYHAEYAKAIAFLEKCVELRQQVLGTDHTDTLNSQNSLAVAYREAGRLPEAIRLFEQVRSAFERTLGPDHPRTLTTLDNLAGAYHAAGRLPEAIRLFEKVRSAFEQTLGSDHVHTLIMLNNLARAYQDAGRLPEAIRLYEQARFAFEQKLGPDHPDTLITLQNLAGTYQDAGRLPEAIRLYEQARFAFEQKLGPDHLSTLTTLNNLAGAYRAAGRLPEAIRLYEQVRTAVEQKLGPDHPSTLTTLSNLAGAYCAAGRLPEAIRLYEQVRSAQQQKLGADHPSTLTTLVLLASAYQAAGRLPEALPLFEQATQGVAKRRFQHNHAQGIISNTIRAYEEAKQFDKAEAWQRKWLAHVKEQSGAESPAYAGELAVLGLNLLKQQKWAEAEAVLRECLAIREKKEPEAWTTFNARSTLGGALVGRAGSVSDGSEKAKLLSEAERLLLQGYEGIQARLASEGKDAELLKIQKQRLAETCDRLIQLYTLLDKPDDVKKWQAEQEKWK